jgi:hypothetical protein
MDEAFSKRNCFSCLFGTILKVQRHGAYCICFLIRPFLKMRRVVAVSFGPDFISLIRVTRTFLLFLYLRLQVPTKSKKNDNSITSGRRVACFSSFGTRINSFYCISIFFVLAEAHSPSELPNRRRFINSPYSRWLNA